MKTTFMAKPADIQRKWYVIDGEGKALGRVAAEAARILRGKHTPMYTPHVDTGDHVIVINADKVILTGKKLDQKMYTRHSGYPGGLTEIPYRKMMDKRPELMVERAIKGMLPHNRLGDQQFKKLKVHSGAEHGHQAQKPEVWNF